MKHWVYDREVTTSELRVGDVVGWDNLDLWRVDTIRLDSTNWVTACWTCVFAVENNTKTRLGDTVRARYHLTSSWSLFRPIPVSNELKLKCIRELELLCTNT